MGGIAKVTMTIWEVSFLILVLDAGNSNIVLGVYDDNDQLAFHWRMVTDLHKTEDEYAMQVLSFFNHAGISFEQITGIIISSVVPPIMFSLEAMCQKYFRKKPLVVGPGVKTGLNIKYENPREVGSDRIVNAIAALDLYKAPCIIVDFGTATTYCYLNEKGDYMGGELLRQASLFLQRLFIHRLQDCRVLKSFDLHISWGGKRPFLPCRREFFMALSGKLRALLIV